MNDQPRRRRTATEEVPLGQQIVNSSNSEPEQVETFVGPDPSTITTERLIPSGITLLNCACSDLPFGAFALGSINTIPGKSASGKTELMLSMLASCAISPRFNNHLLINDDAEHAMGFNLEYLFPPLVDRMKGPRYEKDEPIYSETIQDFEANILTLCRGKSPFIYVLDSLDSLTSTQELEREWKNALKNVKSKEALDELKKTYGTEKARIIGEVLRMVNKNIKKSDSALFIVQQTRQKIKSGPFDFGPDWITAGGEAPFFYSFHRVFLNGGKAITAEAKNIKHQIGGHTKCEVVKNKLTGKRRKSGVEFDIYDDFGIDDVASCVDFLKTTGFWWTEGAFMFAPGILGDQERMYQKDLIRYIEKENAIYALQSLVGKIWNEIETEIRVSDRKRRF